ncbi:MAG: DNA primase, partial [Opitutaceae bacterium]
ARANELAHEVLGRGLDDMPPQTRRLLGLVQQMQQERAKKHNGAGGHWRRRDLRAFTGWSDTALKVHLARLVELEYVLVQRDPEHVQGQLYELLFDGDVVAGKPHLSGLLEVEALRREEAAATTANRSGQNADRSAPGQPVVSPRSGGGQGHEIAASSSEKCEPHGLSSENAQPGLPKNDAAA